MASGVHEIRDPIHVFVRLDDAERKVLDSAPLQRLRHIHQLALTYLVYPGATHKRFEHSLYETRTATVISTRRESYVENTSNDCTAPIPRIAE